MGQGHQSGQIDEVRESEINIVHQRSHRLVADLPSTQAEYVFFSDGWFNRLRSVLTDLNCSIVVLMQSGMVDESDSLMIPVVIKSLSRNPRVIQQPHMGGLARAIPLFCFALRPMENQRIVRKVALKSHCQGGFSAAGIYPFDPRVVSKEKLLLPPTTTTSISTSSDDSNPLVRSGSQEESLDAEHEQPT
ncbi:unnamed protein product [Sphagnum troendelagicum]|uniref:Uncharacterized protein n=1 Tax=Sphagnum troendelagicum TaxID=128251 RepID=A0ABP0TAD9_9BRYO